MGKMVKISPVRIQQAGCPALFCVSCHPPDIFIGILVVIHQPGPAADPRAVVKRHSRFRKTFCIFIRHVRLIPPVQKDGILRNLRQEIRIFHNDIAPHHGRTAKGFHIAAQLADILHVGIAHAFLFTVCPAFSFPKVKGLICTDIEFIRMKQRTVFGNYLLHHFHGCRIADIHSMMLHSAVGGVRFLIWIVQLAQVFIALCPQNFV